MHTVDKRIQQRHAIGGVEAAPKPAGKRKVTAEAARRAYELLLDGQQKGAHDVALDLGKKGSTEGYVHPTIVDRSALTWKQLGKIIKHQISVGFGSPRKAAHRSNSGKVPEICSEGLIQELGGCDVDR